MTCLSASTMPKAVRRNLPGPRVSLLRLPQSELEGVTWQSLDVQFPVPGGPSSDLESASPIPGGKGFLFAESGQEGESDQRIFFAVYGDNTLTIEAEVAWPVPIENVEAIEVGQQLARSWFFCTPSVRTASHRPNSDGLRFRWIRWHLGNSVR